MTSGEVASADPKGAIGGGTPFGAEPPALDAGRGGGAGFVASSIASVSDIGNESDLCAIRVNDAKRSATPLPLKGEEPVFISGWIADDATMSWPKGAMLLVEKVGRNSSLWQLNLPEEGSVRGDVERKFNLASMRMTGFKLTASLAGLPAGVYRLHAAYTGKDGVVICRRGGALSIAWESRE